MRRFFFISILLVSLVASAACAQTLPHNRFVILDTFADSSTAGAALAQGGASVLATQNAAEPYIRFTILYGDFVLQQPPIVPTQWHEFKAPSSGDSWCVANILHPAFPSPTQCAAYWLDRFKAGGTTYAGEVTTSEGSVVVWWF